MSLSDLPRYELCRVESLAALCELLHRRTEEPAGTVLLAGGTDFLVEVSQGAPRHGELPLVVDVSRMRELGGVDWDGRRMRIGANVSYLELERHPAVREHAPLLARMSHDIGGPTIQARGTLGGNFATASPAADGVAALAAFDPIIEVESVRGRRRIPMAELQTGYKRSTRAVDEVIVAFELEPPPHGSHWIWRKVGTRMAQAISKVAFAAVAQLGGGAVTRFGAGMASVAPVTALLPTVRALLIGTRPQAIDVAALDAAVEADIAPIDDLRSTRDYRGHCAKALVRGFVGELAELTRRS